MTWKTDALAELGGQIWRRLADACADPADPFRLPGLATVSDGTPSVRVVVLRQVNEPARALDFFTDIRSPKVSELRACPHAEWLFYDPGARIQVRAAARAAIHFQDEVTEAAWCEVPPANKLAYASPLPPGSPLEGCGGPRALPAVSDPAISRANFAVVRTTVERLDWLWLRDAGHVRAAFEWVDGRWNAHWLTP